MTINPGWFQTPDVGTNALAAFERGQQQRQQRDGNAAMSAYATSPNDQTLNALAPHNPQFVIGERGRMAAQQKAQQEASDKKQHDTLVQVSRLFDGVGDEATYQQRIQMAGRMGLDLTDAPPQFDPAWVQETGAIFKFFADKPEAMSTVGKQAVDEGFQPGTPEFNGRVVELGNIERTKIITPQPGAGAMAYNPATGQTNVIVQPNDGSGQFGAPGAKPVATKAIGGVTYYQTPDGQWHDSPPGGQPGGTAPFSGDFRGLPGERVTSGYRTPGHNKEVGGGGNSFHMRRDAQGRPLGRDSTPPPGISMRAYHNQLVRLNPDKDVIFEGDHVHMEPRGR